MIFIGIDPGKGGGIAYLSGKDMEAIRYPTDLQELVFLLRKFQYSSGCIAIMERVHSFPNQGVKSTFSFGENFGTWKGLLAATDIKYSLVQPKKWMSFYGELPKEKQKRKNHLKNIAKSLYPSLKVTLYTADAILLAHYIKETYEKED